MYAVLSDINQTIVREKNPQAMLAAACRIAVEKGGFRLAWIGLVDPADGQFKIAASAGANDDTVKLFRSPPTWRPNDSSHDLAARRFGNRPAGRLQ